MSSSSVGTRTWPADSRMCRAVAYLVFFYCRICHPPPPLPPPPLWLPPRRQRLVRAQPCRRHPRPRPTCALTKGERDGPPARASTQPHTCPPPPPPPLPPRHWLPLPVHPTCRRRRHLAMCTSPPPLTLGGQRRTATSRGPTACCHWSLWHAPPAGGCPRSGADDCPSVALDLTRVAAWSTVRLSWKKLESLWNFLLHLLLWPPPLATAPPVGRRGPPCRRHA